MIGAGQASAPTHPNASYAAAKAAADTWTLALADRFKGTGSTANIVVVGAILTPAMRAESPDKDFSTFSPAEQIADAIAYLCSDDAASMNGQRLTLRARTRRGPDAQLRADVQRAEHEQATESEPEYTLGIPRTRQTPSTASCVVRPRFARTLTAKRVVRRPLAEASRRDAAHDAIEHPERHAIEERKAAFDATARTIGAPRSQSRATPGRATSR